MVVKGPRSVAMAGPTEIHCGCDHAGFCSPLALEHPQSRAAEDIGQPTAGLDIVFWPACVLTAG